MMDQGAGWTTGPRLGHVNLVDLVEPRGSVRCQQARQTWSETSSYRDRYPRTCRFPRPTKDGNRLSQTVTYQYGWTPHLNSLQHGFELGAARGSHHYDISL
tara:strand:- start:162 stop:464 length:303 start_codon:yes stop_codon:yes gene_type:complete